MPSVIAATMTLLLSASVTVAAADTEPTPRELASTAEALIQQVREGADGTALDRAEGLYQELLERDAADAEALAGLGAIALSRHRFDEALDLGERARGIAPRSARPLGVVVDALIELGRYEQAGLALDEMLKARPDLASYSRLSYFHELHGRTDLAIDAMERAVIAGGLEEHTEFARVKLADLWLLQGRTDRARDLYLTALDRIPDYIPALHGLAKSALATGDTGEAERLLIEAVSSAALPESLVQLGALQEAAGETDLAGATFASAAALESFHRTGSGVPEPFGAVMEADHGDPTVALEIAHKVYSASASIGAADALAWALHVNGRSAEALERSREALRTGTRDPSILYHAGVIATAAGEAGLGQGWLEDALAGSAAGPAFLRSDIERAISQASSPATR